MSEFFLAYQQTLGFEGFYSNDPRDLGGETWKGIARRKNPDWRGWAIIDEIKKAVNVSDLNKVLNLDSELAEAVQEFYKETFWDAMKLGEIPTQAIAEELFDTAVNMGSVKAVCFLQESLNLLNNNQKHYSDIIIDGHIGPATLKAYSAYFLTSKFPGRSAEKNTKTLLKVMNGLQFERYKEICEQRPDQETFFYGWMNRV